jgi:predicted nucleotidyltransferase
MTLTPEHRLPINTFPPELEAIEKGAGCLFPNLREAAQLSRKKSDALTERLNKEFKLLANKGIEVSGIGLLITGSIARKEVTEGSDCDFLLVSNTTPSHESVIQGLNAVERIVVQSLKRYDSIIEILNGSKARDALKLESSREMQTIIDLSAELNSLLQQIFFDDPSMSPLTRGYSLF